MKLRWLRDELTDKRTLQMAVKSLGVARRVDGFFSRDVIEVWVDVPVEIEEQDTKPKELE